MLGAPRNVSRAITAFVAVVALVLVACEAGIGVQPSRTSDPGAVTPALDPTGIAEQGSPSATRTPADSITPTPDTTKSSPAVDPAATPVVPPATPTNTAVPAATPTAGLTTVSQVQTIFGQLECASMPEPTFTEPFFPPEQIAHIVPMGRMWDSHVTPTDHIYVIRNSDTDDWIRSPSDSLLVSVGRFPRDQDENQDLRIILAHSCNVFTIYIHTGPLAEEVAAIVGEVGPGETWYATHSGAGSLRLEAGQPFALNVRGSFDFSAHDSRVELAGFQVPAHYEGEAWKIHTIAPFERYEPTLRDAYRALSLRSDGTPGGRIDYDVMGTLAGNWFADGTVGYGGGGVSPSYWDGHLAIAYDHIDSASITISIGEPGIREALCPNCFGIFGVMGNGPSPESITAADGLVKYELVRRERVFGEEDVTVPDESTVLGVLLAEVVDEDTIRIEVFAGMTADQVTAFTGNAILYNR